MFGSKKLLAEVQRLLKRHTWQQNWRIEQLERDLKDMRTWNEKVRAKNSVLRHERRRLRQILDDHDIPWVRENPGG